LVASKVVSCKSIVVSNIPPDNYRPTTNDSELAMPSLHASFTKAMSAIGGFEHNPALAVAVSGGADSMALLLLTQAWVKQKNGHVIALTVDHGLRPESAAEALQVQQWCKERDIKHHILTLPSFAIRHLSSGVQAVAREARYRLLTNWCKDHRILHLMTAHHRDDQAETLFLRLGRGSAIDGLACMPALSQMHGICLLRPLLALSKTELTAMLKQGGQPWIEDPSNQNPDYMRNRIRQALRDYSPPDESGAFPPPLGGRSGGKHDGYGLSQNRPHPNPSPNGEGISRSHAESLSERAYQVTQRFAKIRNTLETTLARHIANTIAIFPEGYATIDHAAFLVLPPDYGLRALAALTLALNGDNYPPRTEKLQRLYEEVLSGTIKRRSFAGLLFIAQPRPNQLLVCREPEAIATPLTLAPNTTAQWDSRFTVSWAGADDTLTVRALGSDGIRLLNPSKTLKKKAVLAALPAFWRLEEFVAVPHMGFTHDDYRHIRCTARFCPAKPLAAPAFFSHE